MTAGGDASDGIPGAVVAAGLVVLALCGALAGLFDVLLVPLYVGSVPFPLAVLLAVVGNIVLARLARSLRPKMSAAVIPFVTWLIVVVGFGVVARPEGDVILPGGSLQWVTYSMVLGGAVAGMFTAALTGLPPRRPTDGTPTEHVQSAGS